MTKITQNMLIILKITDFLLGLEFRSKSLFCRYWCVTYVCQFSCMYVKHSWKAVDFLGIGGAVEPFCHTLFWILYQTKIFTRFDACAKFHDFLSMLKPSKMRFIREKKKKKNNNNKKQSRYKRVLAPRCSGPNNNNNNNNKRSNSKRVLAPSVLGP